MAQKKGLIYRLTMGKDNQPDFELSKLPGTRWQVFKDVFKMRFGALVKINLLVLLFALPAIALVVIFNLVKGADGTLLPYGGNIGIGYPIITDIVAVGEFRANMFNFQMFLWLVPCIMIASIGLSGAFAVMRRLVWGEGVAVASHFFRGIKDNFFPFLWSSLFMGISVLLVALNFTVYEQAQINEVLRGFGIAFSIIQCVLLCFMLMFLTTQAVTYKLKFWPLIKNSFLFAIALLPQNVLFLALSALPIIIILILPSFLQMFGYVIFAVFGFSFVILLWTVYAHWAFDKFVNDRVEGAVKNKGMYVPTEEELEKRKAEKEKTNNVRYVNPKKKKSVKSIDEGATFTPLSSNFSRADLAKLQEEKETVKKEIESGGEDDDGTLDSPKLRKVIDDDFDGEPKQAVDEPTSDEQAVDESIAVEPTSDSDTADIDSDTGDKK